ncbi:hypothetical protein WJX74_006898 [Apatococcus lobatus]|uniref:Protein arginine N-methyltransferase n=1 Tax=Apatococcus lobatus TaxID=904363 RepID=A0AAW1QDH7_9CHLO
MPLGKRTDCGDARYAGCVVAFSNNPSQHLQAALQSGFDFITAPLADPAYRRPAANSAVKGAQQPDFSVQNLLLISSKCSSQVVGQASEWLQPDAADADLRAESQKRLRAELDWASHLSMQAVILPTPPALNTANFAQALTHALAGQGNMAMWVTLPMIRPNATSTGARASQMQSSTDAGSVPEAASDHDSAGRLAEDTWEWWHQLRTLCSHPARLGLLLEVPTSLPSQQEIHRWLGEPVRALLLPTHIFLTNKRGYPTLSRAHQSLVSLFLQHHVQILMTGPSHHAVPGSSMGNGQQAVQANGPDIILPDQHPLQVYLEYASFLFRRLPTPEAQELMEVGYRDYLQAPLQPLQDNLESQTYETFERDDTKYSSYERAVHAALLDAAPRLGERHAVIMVVGAGRGPLVRASLQAAEKAGRAVRVFAVEKNPNAVIELQAMLIREGWEDAVDLVMADMREWEAPEQADFIVSELLGSLADNELSPECLDGAQRFLAPQGVFIPSSYNSFIQPITSAKLWNDVRNYDDQEHFETSFVVKLHNFSPLAAPQLLFSFQHPADRLPPDNTRFATLMFERPNEPSQLCHGLGGYFDCVLYKDITLSTLPATHTPGMFSWFPIYFPLQDPVYCPAGAAVHASMWRCTGAHKVWYEWMLSRPAPTHLHNPLGRSSFVGL